jgi:drug/metabolite transporter (DMT)-like permease
MTEISAATAPASHRQGHILALFSILVWGTTFVSTTVLLEDFNPSEILFIRVSLAIAALALARPRRLRLNAKKHEWYFAGAGLCGVTLYFLLENVALTFTNSANCSVIISTAPFFVALAVHWFLKGERLSHWFFLGFAAAIGGVILISFSGQQLQLNPLGDLLCVLAAISWAGYSVFVKKIDQHGYDTLLVTRRIFCYGILFLLPCLPFLGFSPSLENLVKPLNLFNFLFLGLGASALCFVTWNTAVKRLGAVKTSVYIYVSPAVTIATAWLLLRNPILPMSIVGAALTLLGLIISQRGAKNA